MTQPTLTAEQLRIIEDADYLNIAAKAARGEPLSASERMFIRRKREEREQADSHQTLTQPSSQTHRARMATRSKLQSVAERNIGGCPECGNKALRDSCRHDLALFCKTYFPNTFYLEWSDVHLKVIRRMQDVILYGGTFAIAMPRAYGKTSLVESACIWAACYGHRKFIVLIGSDEGHAVIMLDSIKLELEMNDLLARDFPQVCFPVRSLEGIAGRCSGQHSDGRRTLMEWGAKTVVLPTIVTHAADGGAIAPSSGVIIRTVGITGGVRGLKHKLANGETIRPDLVIPDDPQTDESARSLSQVEHREALLSGAILGLAGAGKKIAAIMPCTVIVPNDLADRMLDRTRNPMWQGERFPMMESMPTNMPLWGRYHEILSDSFRAGRKGEDATAFYLANRDSMDLGAKPTWPARYNKDELSAIQNAMNLYFRDEHAFWSEYQNQPKSRIETPGRVQREWVLTKNSGLPRFMLPVNAEVLTAHFDVQKELIFYTVCAWTRKFDGWIVDYSEFPDQQRRYFTLVDAQRTLSRQYKGRGVEACIFAGLMDAATQVLGREYQRADGVAMRVSMALVDAAWGESTETVYQFCRTSPHAAVLMPSFGRFVGASSTPMNNYTAKPGERVGHNWRMPSPKGRRYIRHVIYDANFWKSFVRTRLATPMGERGGLLPYKHDSEHRLLADHCCAELPVPVSAQGREVEEWKLPPHKPDNHFWDNLVACAVGASMQGCTFTAAESAAKSAVPKKRVVNRKRVAYL